MGILVIYYTLSPFGPVDPEFLDFDSLMPGRCHMIPPSLWWVCQQGTERVNENLLLDKISRVERHYEPGEGGIFLFHGPWGFHILSNPCLFCRYKQWPLKIGRLGFEIVMINHATVKFEYDSYFLQMAWNLIKMRPLAIAGTILTKTGCWFSKVFQCKLHWVSGKFLFDQKVSDKWYCHGQIIYTCRFLQDCSIFSSDSKPPGKSWSKEHAALGTKEQGAKQRAIGKSNQMSSEKLEMFGEAQNISHTLW